MTSAGHEASVETREQRIAFASIVELGQMLRDGETSPVELTELFLERLRRIGPQLNAVVTLTEARARAQAEVLGNELRAGHDRGPRHGIPFGAKDLLATGGGVPTSWGAAPFRGQQFAGDALVLQRLEAAGAILVAKLAMVELAGGFGYAQPNATFTGPGINPWNTSYWSGGSSSGSGSAVAAGLVPYALGSETWGSILNPASSCGITGLRPTLGLVPTRGAMALSWTLDKLGPLCRTAEDAAIITGYIGGDDAEVPATRSWSIRPFGFRRSGFTLALPRGLADDPGLQPEVRHQFVAALNDLRTIATIEDVDLPEFPYVEAARIIIQCEAASAFDDFLASGRASELTAPEDRFGGYAGLTIPAVDYIRALRIRRKVAASWYPMLAPYDALLVPPTNTTARRLDMPWRGNDAHPESAAVTITGAAGNLAGLPAITVPSGFDAKGLPTAISLVGRPFDEQTVVAVAHAYQQLSSWHRRHPAW